MFHQFIKMIFLNKFLIKYFLILIFKHLMSKEIILITTIIGFIAILIHELRKKHKYKPL